MKSFDVVVIGGGILGMAHAWASARRGLSVAVVERARQAHGATIRNFGQVLVTGQAPGDMANLARQTRALWLQLAGQAGFHVRANGSLVLARTAQESDVLEEFASHRLAAEGYAARLLSNRELAAFYGGRLEHHCAALRGEDDLQIYSREALPAITRHLGDDLGVAMIHGTLARKVEGGEVDTTAGRFKAGHVFACPGHDYLMLWPEIFAPLNLELSRLQMLRVAFVEQAFLRPARKRPNLRVMTGARVERVVFAQKRAAGVQFVDEGGQRRVAQARGEVLLSAGAIGSAQL
ncbi:FAD-dependent oxidoreductase, partial [Bordetella holmesii]|uniref:FAD-dependent oxidoreductase n=1 Tax=Bordetella holmesii TaxID=35814 RepID=UPI00045B6805